MGKPGILSFIHTRDLSPREKRMLGEKLRARRTQLRQMLALVNKVFRESSEKPCAQEEGYATQGQTKTQALIVYARLAPRVEFDTKLVANATNVANVYLLSPSSCRVSWCLG